MNGRISVLLFLILTYLHRLSHVQCENGIDLINRITPKTLNGVQEKAVRALIERVVGVKNSKLFDVEVNKMLPERSYKVSIII